MRILVVEDEYLIAQQIAQDISNLGDTVIGPFACAADAIGHVPDADAAILDVRLGDYTSFSIADALHTQERPFVFLTGYTSAEIPLRFQMQPIHSKPGLTRSILVDLHDRHLRSDHAGGARDILVDMLAYARLRIKDRSAAERLVEAVMLDAIIAVENDVVVSDLRGLLIDLLDREIRSNLLRYLN
ncbi:response regulator [Paracoccus nototheniae]|uniref:Response regulator n=1 Tax=Paracoccus nototheniae TaxID=2489002 RepID=A0ABW4DTL3_9RHOB|nr:response regulator [Paracoccus nototheniae]